MPTIDLTDAEHAALVALIRRALEEDRLHAPRASTRRTRPWRSSIPQRRTALRRPLTPQKRQASPRPPGSPKPPKAAHGPPEALHARRPNAAHGGNAAREAISAFSLNVRMKLSGAMDGRTDDQTRYAG
jgi:hypothetical protein